MGDLVERERVHLVGQLVPAAGRVQEPFEHGGRGLRRGTDEGLLRGEVEHASPPCEHGSLRARPARLRVEQQPVVVEHERRAGRSALDSRTMNTRRLGRTGVEVSEIGFGAWAIGGDWGATDDEESLAAMHAAVDAGVTFFDTADVYGDGRSERLIGRLVSERPERLVVATKFGRRAPLDVAQLHATTISAPGSSARARTSASMSSTSSSSTARRGRSTTSRGCSRPATASSPTGSSARTG